MVLLSGDRRGDPFTPKLGLPPTGFVFVIKWFDQLVHGLFDDSILNAPVNFITQVATDIDFVERDIIQRIAECSTNTFLINTSKNRD